MSSARIALAATLVIGAALPPTAQATDSFQPNSTLLISRPPGFGSLPDDSVGSLHRSTAGGKQHLRFSGRIGTRRLAAGRYVLTARARDAAGTRSKPVTTTLRVKRR